MTNVRPVLLAAGLAALTLTACESLDDKAERLYQESLELVDQGETERAIVTLRNVFRANGEMVEARLLYAELMMQSGNPQEAYSHFLLAAEQAPDLLEPRLNLSRIALEVSNWDEAERHISAANRIDPDNVRVQTYKNILDYRRARQSEDRPGIETAFEKAKELLEANPDDLLSRKLVIDKYTMDRDLSKALSEIETALQIAPQNSELNQAKLGVLVSLDDRPAIGEQLKKLVELFPENKDYQTSLLRWYTLMGDLPGAEGFLREIAAANPDDFDAKLGLVRFINQTRGYDATVEEINTLIAAGEDVDRLELLKATLAYDNEGRDVGIAQIEAILAKAEPATSFSRETKTTLARMLVGVGEDDRAADLVDEVLAEDGQNVEALKLKANRLVDHDQTRDAILALRTALDQEPGDAEAITLLARAYERDGNPELMAESLARAVDVSNHAPAETLRYAKYLIGEERYLPAEDVLIDGLRASPSNLEILSTLGATYIGLTDWPRTEQVIRSIRALGTDEARAAAAGLETTMLNRTDRSDESIELLQDLISEGQPNASAQAAIVRTHLVNGDIASARSYMDGLLGEIAPDDVSDYAESIRFINAALLAAERNYTDALATYSDLSDRNPDESAVWRAYATTLLGQGEYDQARNIIDRALATLPDDSNLLWLKASMLERDGDFEGAIAIYDALYTADSNSMLVANNLASLLTTYRHDDESLQRAHTIARRLRGQEIPALQDTYGWIAFRMGSVDEAIPYLESAAEALPNEPTVQYHLAKAYVAKDRAAEARPLLEKAIALWGDAENPQLPDARETLDNLPPQSAENAQ